MDAFVRDFLQGKIKKIATAYHRNVPRSNHGVGQHGTQVTLQKNLAFLKAPPCITV